MFGLLVAVNPSIHFFFFFPIVFLHFCSYCSLSSLFHFFSLFSLFSNASTWLEVVDLIFLWLENKLARAITKWTRANDTRLARLISYIHHVCELKQCCRVGKHGLFQDSDFAGDLEDSKSTSGGVLCIFGSHTFVPRYCG